MTLYVTRHGETTYNAQRRFAGSSDAPLNDTGIAQAHDLAARLNNTPLDAIVTTPLSRARHTAQIICAAKGMTYDIYPEFAERNMGVYEGLTREECRDRYPELWIRLAPRLPDDGPYGGETIRAFDIRVARGLARLRGEYPDKNVLLVCHGFTGRIINRQLMGLDFTHMHDFTLGNCEVAEYTI